MAALLNTAAAADEARVGSILSASFARRRGQLGIAQNSAVLDGREQPTPTALLATARTLATLDLAGLADDIAAKLKQQVITGMDAWRAAQAVVPEPLHATLGRLVEVQLGRATIDAMRKMREAKNWLDALELEKARGPVMPKAPFFTLGIAYDYYASLVQQYGSQPARDALKTQQIVLLALRNQSSTLAHRGLGSYDDQIVVLNGVGRLGVARVFTACTEPGAQYAHREALHHSGARVDARYASIKLRHVDGEDINHDGIRDLGRLIQGTYQYFWRSTPFHSNRVFAVRVRQIVERDTDGDSRFTTDDPQRIDPWRAQTTMYIHPGGKDDTSGAGTGSAGCQTIPMPVWGQFVANVGAVEKGFYYVLVDAAIS